MTLHTLPVTIGLQSVTATRNGGAAKAEPYLLTVFFKVDGQCTKLVPRADGKLTLTGDPIVKRTDSRHDNLAKVRDGETVPVPDGVGRCPFVMKPIPRPGPRGHAVAGASGVVGLLYVLAEEDSASDGAIRAGYEAVLRELTTWLRHITRSVVVDPAAPSDDAFPMSAEVEKAMTRQIWDELFDTVLGTSTVVELRNLDDILGIDVHVFGEGSLLAEPSQRFSKRFDVGKRGDWTVNGFAEATVPPDLARRGSGV